MTRATDPPTSQAGVELRLSAASTAKQAHLQVRGLGAGEFRNVIASFGQLISMGDISANDHRVVALMHRRIRELGADLGQGGGTQPQDGALAREIALDPVLRPLLRQQSVRALLPPVAWDPQMGPSRRWWARIRDAIDRVEIRPSVASIVAGSGQPPEPLDGRAWERQVELALAGFLRSERTCRADVMRRPRPAAPPAALAGAQRGRQPGAAGRARIERLGNLRARYLELPPDEQDALANNQGAWRPWLREHAERHHVSESVAYNDWKQVRDDLLAQGRLPVLNPPANALEAGDARTIQREKRRLRGLGQPQ